LNLDQLFRPQKINLIYLNATEIFPKKGLDLSSSFLVGEYGRSIMERASWNMKFNLGSSKSGVNLMGPSLEEYPAARAGSCWYPQLRV